MILNSKNSQFIFKFPRGFVYKNIEEKYNFYLKRLPTPFETITDYINHTIQSVVFPSVSTDEVEQWNGRLVSIDTPEGRRTGTKNPQYWRQSVDLERAVPKEFTVTFKVADGYLNYWVLYEVYRNYLLIPEMNDYFPDLHIMFLDREGYQILTVTYRQPIIKSISEVEMNYSSYGMDFRTFSLGFKYNNFDIAVKTD